jgi:RNA polymerase sigma-70 factor, ECF subfamily
MSSAGKLSGADSFLSDPASSLLSVVTFDVVYARHAGFVFRVLKGMGVAERSLEDAVQDVFVVVHRRLPEFDGRHKVRTWLFEITFRIACEYRRKQQRTRDHSELPEGLHSAGASPADQLEQREVVLAVARTLDKLDDHKRATLMLADIEELTVPEIAELTQTPANTVYTRLRRARQEFQEAWSHVRRRDR